MATESQAAASWASIPRSGSLLAWTGIAGALTTVDANWAEWPLIATPALTFTSEKLRSTYPAFSLPPADIITSIKVYVRHKQPSADVQAGATCVIENTGDDFIAQNAFFVTTINLPTTTYTIAALNAGGVTHELLYTASNASFPLIFPDLCPYVDVDQTILEVITSGAVPTSTLENALNVIPSINIKVIQ